MEHSTLPALTWLCGAAAALVLALAGGRILGWADRAPVEGWMTPRFVMLAYGLPAAELDGLLGPDGVQPNRTLDRIAAETGRPRIALVAEVEAAAQRHAGAGG